MSHDDEPRWYRKTAVPGYQNFMRNNHLWHHHDEGTARERYLITDYRGKAIALVTAEARGRLIDKEGNVRLRCKDIDDGRLKEVYTGSLEDALDRGQAHADRYYREQNYRRNMSDRTNTTKNPRKPPYPSLNMEPPGMGRSYVSGATPAPKQGRGATDISGGQEVSLPEGIKQYGYRIVMHNGHEWHHFNQEGFDEVYTLQDELGRDIVQVSAKNADLPLDQGDNALLKCKIYEDGKLIEVCECSFEEALAKGEAFAQEYRERQREEASYERNLFNAAAARETEKDRGGHSR